MRKKVAFFTVIFVLTRALGFSLSFADLGYTVQRQYADSGITYSDLTDDQNRSVTVGVSGSGVSQLQADILDEFLNRFYAMEYIDIEALKVVFIDGRTEVVVLPASFNYNGMDLARYMPSGMQFYYVTSLEYDFRIRVDNFFLRFFGQYTDEVLLAERLVAAVNNPTQIARNQDSQYLAQRLDIQSQALNEAAAAVRQAESRMHALAGEVNNLKSETQALRTKYDLVVSGIMALHNKGIFGAVRLPGQDAVNRIIVLKQQNPDWTKSEVLKQLREEEYKLSANEVFLVLALYFNEFE